MSDPLQELFEAVREACTSAQWSRGVELARAQAVSVEREDDEDVVLRVATGTLVSPAATLSPAHGDWDCECPSRDGACEHVAAAVIALRRAKREGTEPPGAEAGAAGRIGYRFTRQAGALHFERVIAGPDGEVPLAGTLLAVSEGRVEGPRFVASRDDVEVERTLGTRLRGEIPPGVWPKLLADLARCPDVRLDGEPVTTRSERLGWVARLDDDGDGFRLSVSRDPRIEEVFRGGVVLAGGTLCREGESRLTGREREELVGGRHFSADEAAELATERLPSLRERMPVEVRSVRLPETTRVEPRIRLDVEREGDALCVLPTLVYGDPAVARIDAGRLVPLGGSIPLRDEAAERRLVRRLQEALELAPGHRVALRGEEAVSLAERLARWPGERRGAALDAFRRAPELVPRLAVRDARLELAFHAGEGGASADPQRVLRAWRAGESLVPLQEGGFAPLPGDWLSRFGDRLADLLAARRGDGSLPPAALPELGALCDELGEPVPDAVAALRGVLERRGPAPPATLPADLRATLRDYQRHGVDWLCALREAGVGALLADDMGLGKTLQALCALRGHTLVVAPTSVLHNWADEIARFRPALRAHVYRGPGRSLEPDADVTLTSYAILRLDADALAAVDWDTVVLDEAQAIKNPDSQVARAAFALRGGFRIALSGTPVENRLEELWSQFHFLNRGLLGGRRDFEERYARPVAAGDEGAAGRLRDRIRPFVLRRRKREVAPELPPRTEVTLHATLSERERAVYDAIRAATRTEVVEKLAAGGGVLQALEALLRLRQAACHAGLVPGQRAETSAKLELLLESLESSVADGHKALVFSQWTSLLDRVEPHLERAGIPFARLDGSTRDRGAVVARFQAESGPPVMLLSLKAGGLGLNLTAADCVFVLDPWWNPAVEDQAADRAHRIGQERPVLVCRLVAEDTVEERILALQQRKRGLAEAALGEAGAVSALSRDELLELLD